MIEQLKPFTPLPDHVLLNKTRIRTKIETLKKLWKAWVAIIAVSGWTVDPISGLPKNDEAVMKAYQMCMLLLDISRPNLSRTETTCTTFGKARRRQDCVQEGSDQPLPRRMSSRLRLNPTHRRARTVNCANDRQIVLSLEGVNIKDRTNERSLV